MYDRALHEWSTMALISSLLLTLTYQIFITNFDENEHTGTLLCYKKSKVDLSLTHSLTHSLIYLLTQSILFLLCIYSLTATGSVRVDLIISALSFASTLLFITVIAASVLLTMGILTLPKKCAALYIQEFALIATLPEFATVAGTYPYIHSLFTHSFIIQPRDLCIHSELHIYWVGDARRVRTEYSNPYSDSIYSVYTTDMDLYIPDLRSAR